MRLNRARIAKSKHYNKQCSGKKGFFTADKAEREISRAFPQTKMNVYRCPWCGLFHIGHPS